MQTGQRNKNEFYGGQEAEMLSKLLALMKKLINKKAYHMQPLTLVQLHKYKMKQFNFHRSIKTSSDVFQKHTGRNILLEFLMPFTQKKLLGNA